MQIYLRNDKTNYETISRSFSDLQEENLDWAGIWTSCVVEDGEAVHILNFGGDVVITDSDVVEFKRNVNSVNWRTLFEMGCKVDWKKEGF